MGFRKAAVRRAGVLPLWEGWMLPRKRDGVLPCMRARMPPCGGPMCVGFIARHWVIRFGHAQQIKT